MSELMAVLLSGQTTGIYGKLASHGDFVLRRLPQEFVVPWDAWLQQGIAESRLALGDEWETRYQDAPVWRFLLPAGLCGETAWAGILQPSIDRVGRHFPLTAAAALPGNVNALETMMNARDWYAELERETAAAFSADVQLDALDRQLEQLVFPERFVVRADVSDDTLPMGERVFSAFKITIPLPASPDVIRTTLGNAQVSVGPFDCVWSDVTSPENAAVFLLSKGLPSAERFCAMLDGQWARRGWELASQADTVN